MSDQGAPPSGEETTTPDAPEGTTATPEQSYQEKLDKRLEELSKQSQQQYDEWRSWRDSQESDDEEPEDDEDLLEEGDDGFEEQEAQRYLQELVEQRVDQELAPVRQQQANQARDRAFEKLTANFPEFENEEVARKYATEAHSILEDLNPAAIEDHRFVYFMEKLYKADKADERAAQETPPQRTASLEHGGGATPAAQEDDLEDRIMKLAQDSTF